ncbi:MAG: hypothetical protein AB7N65_24620 [Vicinamibacterales bacterium]
MGVRHITRAGRGVASVAVLMAMLLTAMSALVARAEQLVLQHERGQGVTPVFEGWYRNPNGTFTLSFGYLNRNFKERLDIPIGSENRIAPGDPDQGQPAHFLPRRQWGVFGVVVPADFGSQRLTWTLAAHGQTNAVPGSLNPIYEIPALRESTAGNTPPKLQFGPSGPTGQGPLGVTTTVQASDRSIPNLHVRVTDDGVVSLQQEGRSAPLSIKWQKYRGPGNVTFDTDAPNVDASGLAQTGVRFEQPGEYTLRVLANDHSGDGGGGSQCCWTNGYVKTTIR